MRAYHPFLILAALFFTQQTFADVTKSSTDPDEASSPYCEKIANACLSAGYERNGSPGKAFWRDCMKPVLFGRTVTDVTIDSKDAQACRKFKIQNLRQQLEELQKVKSK